MKLIIGTSSSKMTVTKNDNSLELPTDTNECIATDKSDKIIPVTILIDSLSELVTKDNKVLKGKLISRENGVTIKTDDDVLHHFKSYKSVSDYMSTIAMVDSKGPITYNFKTSLIQWTPRILVKINEEGELRSTLIASITNRYRDLDDVDIDLIGEYQPSSRYGYQMEIMSSSSRTSARAVSPSRSIAEAEPTGSFAYHLDLDHLVEGKRLIPILEESIVKFNEVYQARLYSGKQLAQRVIIYQSPDDYPAGQYTFILPSGVNLDVDLGEVQEKQEVRQSIGPSSNVIVSTTIVNRTEKQTIYKVDIKAIKDCQVILTLPYLGETVPKIVSTSKNIKPTPYLKDGGNGWLIDQPVGNSTLTING